MRLVTAFCAFLAIGSATQAFARFSEENLPAQDMPSAVATPDNGPSADWVQVPNGAPPASAPAAVAPANLQLPPSDASAAQMPPAPTAVPTEAPPLEVGSVAPQMQISDAPLDDLIRKLSTTQPALAASLRVTDQARDEILNHHEDDAIQTLQRAISIDGSDPYAYFYVGRAYLAKKNYAQALTFFGRAEIRFGTNPEWLAETLAFEGLANEESGQQAQAIACYQKTLQAVPGNLMARVGLTRLGGGVTASAVQPVSVPDTAGSAAPPPPDGSTIAPPPNSPPPPPAN
jgi:tetratricopeptide (TPR) repeat protein